MKEYLYFALGIVVLIGALMILRYADRIRESRYWFAWALLYLLGLSTAGKLFLPIMDRIPVDNDQAVLVLAGAVMCIAVLIFGLQMYRTCRPREPD